MKTIGVDLRVLNTGRTSGIEEYTQQILQHMMELDPSLRWKLFSAGRKKNDLPFALPPNAQQYDTGMSNRLLWATTRLSNRPYLDRIVGGADVFFFPHFLLGAISPECRRVMTWHDLSYELMSELFSWSRRAWHQLQMRPRMQAQAADRIIAVSASTAADIARVYHIPTERISTVLSGVDSRLTRPAAGEIEAFRVRHSLPRRFILVFGTIEPRKNIEGTIAAFEQLAGEPRFADLHLIIAGPHGWLWEPVMERIQASPWRTRITIAGSIASEQRSLWLSAASVLAYPSFMEGFGFPPLEAMACDTPVVVSANSSLFETVGDAGLLIDPYSPDQLARALSAVLDDSNLRDILIARGKKRSADFSWKQSAERTLEAIVSTL
jgi:glycosyltransferase involved in cell wall biosynthesis